jgi:hypothetical protein
MNVIPPIVITDALLTSSTVSEPDAGSPTTEMVFNAGSPSTSYVLGAIVIDTTAHLKYESLAAANGAQLSDATKWLLLGPTNKWAMFDTLRSTATIAPSPLTVVITPGVNIDALALLGLVGDSVTVSVDSAIGSPSTNYYTHTENLDTREVFDWYDYFFSPFSTKPSVALFDLPPHSSAVITVTITAASGNVECGACVMGSQVNIGVVQHDAVSDVLNFSTVTRDFAGGTNTLVQRRNVPKTQQQLLIDKTQVNAARVLRDSLNAIPAVWSGIDDDTDGYFDALLILGFYKVFSINLAFPDQALITLELEEI